MTTRQRCLHPGPKNKKGGLRLRVYFNIVAI